MFSKLFVKCPKAAGIMFSKLFAEVRGQKKFMFHKLFFKCPRTAGIMFFTICRSTMTEEMYIP
jgi:hypothetical protein